MQTPTRGTLEGFYRGRAEWMERETRAHTLTGQVICRTCGDRIHACLAQISIHDAANGECKGNGEAFEAGIPYCARCESMPANTGCVHA